MILGFLTLFFEVLFSLDVVGVELKCSKDVKICRIRFRQQGAAVYWEFAWDMKNLFFLFFLSNNAISLN